MTHFSTIIFILGKKESKASIIYLVNCDVNCQCKKVELFLVVVLSISRHYVGFASFLDQFIIKIKECQTISFWPVNVFPKWDLKKSFHCNGLCSNFGLIGG